jgi:HSP20 family protein
MSTQYSQMQEQVHTAEFDQLAHRMFSTVSRPGATMPMDAYREGNTFYIRFDLPGIKPNSIDLTVEQNVLTIHAERPTLDKSQAELLVTERPTGNFTRRVLLGDTLDAENMTANYADGVLMLSIPVREAAQQPTVEIGIEATAQISPATESTLSDRTFTAQVQAARRNRDLIAKLAQWRAEHGPSQAEIAKRMHTSQPAVARLESHQHDAQLSTLARYVAALGLSLDFVLTDLKTHTPIWTSIIREKLEQEPIGSVEQKDPEPRRRGR